MFVHEEDDDDCNNDDHIYKATLFINLWEPA
jgi:hypothetical protein